MLAAIKIKKKCKHLDWKNILEDFLITAQIPFFTLQNADFSFKNRLCYFLEHILLSVLVKQYMFFLEMGHSEGHFRSLGRGV